MTPHSARFIVGLLAVGMALIFMISDGRSRTTRAMSLWLAAIAAATFSGPFHGSLARSLFSAVMESLAVLAGVEWGRRIGETAASGRLQKAANVLFRIAQGFVLLYAAMMVVYQIFYPELALVRERGPVAVRGIELALFAPVLGTGMVLSAVALLILLLMDIDSAEKVRLRALLGSGPLLLLALVLGDELVPATLTAGLLIIMLGSVRYLMLQSQRGDFMRQFMSPEVAKLMRQSGGMEQVLKRERRVLSVVACDLRGFTAYARERDSNAVANLLERYYAVVGAVSAHHRGMVKDHAGDGVLILVGAPLPLKDHARRAVRLARDLREQMLQLLSTIEGAPGIGIGVAGGRITVGAIQGAGRLEYVAVGNAVNLASRLCSRAAHAEILMDDRTQAALDDGALEQREPELLKGFSEPVAVYALPGMKAT